MSATIVINEEVKLLNTTKYLSVFHNSITY
jgi:hypothetical protein